ncbi:alpha-ketoglutarate-dependent dioxygenase AlkB [Peredibacter starrii]|uniref:Alpha-ketoglutarate-dependent dioxygenase AlkB n=1 Tax=Peredibacter starrii TaxID=28202 RepID=A0AAX4HU23_9BACT|nr:alpha-ketoglutarate-dependent dioxygenase AlkB [Peredibacter starrii]WPU66481.1 alpha-ketoglutarate-dependent dioxygenase AlkB [Peredibacter starrii]
MQKQLAFLEDSPPKGFKYFPDFISVAEEKKLLAFLQSLDWKNIHMHGVIAKRKVVHFGMDYYYDSRTFSPTTPAPKELQFLIKRAAKALKVAPQSIKEILISYYPVGAPIGWHRDAPMFESVFGVSLENSCTMKFRSDSGNYKTELEPRSGYIIEGEARWKWQHHIPAVKTERYSITMRTMKD